MNRRIRRLLLGPYDRPVMNNVHRAHFVECMIALSLGEDWQLTWQKGWDWAAWDIESQSGVRLEVKQAAARQTWDRDAPPRKRRPRFDIAPRTGYWTRDGSRWVERPGRAAKIYVFAWHGEGRVDLCDQSNAEQWLFYVVREKCLPAGQKSIGLKGIMKLVKPCRIDDLHSALADSAVELPEDPCG